VNGYRKIIWFLKPKIIFLGDIGDKRDTGDVGDVLV
jgi:hypothetical protein